MRIDREEFRIEPDIDDELSVSLLNTHLDELNERKKNQIAKDFDIMGEDYLMEIDKKKKQKKIKSSKLIPYIIKKSNNVYDVDELMSYEFNDIQTIYNELKWENRSGFTKLIHFIFNIE